MKVALVAANPGCASANP